MHIAKGMYGDNVVIYESRDEEFAAYKNYKCGNYAALTSEEVALFRSCEEDPNNIRWEAEHAGMMSEGVAPSDIDEIVRKYHLGRTLEEGREMVRQMIGPHPITATALWELRVELNLRSRANAARVSANK